MGIRGQSILAETLAEVPEDDDDLNAEEQENLEETLVDQATASRSIAELEGEIIIRNPRTAGQSGRPARIASGTTSRILQNEPQMHDAVGGCARSPFSANTATP
jgi:hypothetical protein